MYRRTSRTATLLVGFYVDDLVITGMNGNGITEFKEQMHRLFEMSDLGLLSYYLRIEVSQDDGTITLFQKAYIDKILEIRQKIGVIKLMPKHPD